MARRSRQRKLSWAYVAGFTDGDGCISLDRRDRSSVRSTRSLSVALRWAQAEATSEVIDALAEFFAGEGIHYVIVRRSPRGFPQREIIVQRRADVLRVLRAIEPSLVLKRDQARDAIALIEEITEPRLCSVAGCDREYKARGLCNSHYQTAWQRRLVGHGT